MLRDVLIATVLAMLILAGIGQVRAGEPEVLAHAVIVSLQ